MGDRKEDILRQRVEQLEQQVAAMRCRGPCRSVRKRSTTELVGLPLWEIAMGPDPETGQIRGHAKAIIAIGDVATGFLAIGGVARGVLAFGGLAIGLIAFGGAAVGVGLAVGGGAIGAVAIGGAALGGIALGGAAAGYYAFGGGAYGKFIYTALRRDPEAVALVKAVAEFFRLPLP